MTWLACAHELFILPQLVQPACMAGGRWAREDDSSKGDNPAFLAVKYTGKKAGEGPLPGSGPFFTLLRILRKIFPFAKFVKNKRDAPCEDRTHDLRIMRPALCVLS